MSLSGLTGPAARTGPSPVAASFFGFFESLASWYFHAPLLVLLAATALAIGRAAKHIHQQASGSGLAVPVCERKRDSRGRNGGRMNIEDPVWLYRNHVAAISRTLASGLGASEIERDIFAVVRLLRSADVLKGLFLGDLARLLQLTDPGELFQDIPAIELAEVVAHELGWTELRALAEARLQGAPGPGATIANRQAANRILRAFASDLSDRDLYAAYGAAR